jgi:glycosyltransferase involved in cell wall biosynthesis
MKIPDAPLLSICIPTFNRSRYIASALESLVGQLAGFPYPFDVVIADNASPDATGEVVRAFADRLPIRYLRHGANIGAYANWQFVMASATGRYLVYQADDDGLLGEQLAQTIAKMEADPELAVVYAPWLLFDMVAQQQQGQFYRLPHDLRVGRGHHAELLDHILRHHIFPEIQVIRRTAFSATMPRINDHAFFAFVHAADYLTQGAVLLQEKPFYVSITRYFADEAREQLGSDEVEHAWDRYRGGLEYLIARTGQPITAEERFGLHIRIQEMIASRMSVAIRLRHARKRSAVDTYMIAARLRGLGYEQMLPVPLATLASEAMVEFMLRDPELGRGVRQLLCVGTTPREERAFLKREAGVPVEFVPDLERCEDLSDTLLFVREDAVAARGLDGAAAAHRNVRVLHERHLAAKFGL